MALVKCIDCGKDVSTLAQSCPHCGRPVHESTARRKCQDCGNDLSPESSACANCGRPQIKDSVLSSPQIESTIPRTQAGNDETIAIILLVIPAAAALLTFFWIGHMPLADGPMAKLGLLVAATLISTATLVTVEAQKIGFGLDRTRPVEERESPVTWFFAMLFIWVIAYPRYLYLRSRYGVGNFCVPGIVIIILWVIALFLVLDGILQGQRTFERLLEAGPR